MQCHRHLTRLPRDAFAVSCVGPGAQPLRQPLPRSQPSQEIRRFCEYGPLVTRQYEPTNGCKIEQVEQKETSSDVGIGNRVVGDGRSTTPKKTPSLSQAGPRILRVVGNEVKTRQREERKRMDAKSAFGDIIESTRWRAQDGRDKPTFTPGLSKDGGLTRYYTKSLRATARNRRERQLARWDYQKSHHPASSNNWLNILRMLHPATPSGLEMHKKRSETVRLPDGVRAVFKINAGAAILELMRRTGSHAQMMGLTVHIPDNARARKRPEQHGFDALTLWGTPAQNAHAIKLLPGMVHGITRHDEDSRRVLDGSMLRSDVNADFSIIPDARDDAMAFMGKSDSRYWSEQDDVISDLELKRLDEVVNDITHTTSLEAVPLRATWWNSSRRASLSAETNIDLRPKSWSTLNFAAYVEDLTAPASQLAQRRARNASESHPRPHVDTVAQELITLFCQTPELGPFVSSDAVDMALAFFIRQCNFAPVRKLLAALETRETYELTASNFETLLAAAAKNEDVHNFRYLVRLMLQRNIVPTWRTWVYFHELVCRRFAPTAALTVERHMREKGIFANVSAVRSVAANSVAADIRGLALTAGVTLDDFFRIYDGRFGIDDPHSLPIHKTHAPRPRPWLTPRAANGMITFLLSQGRSADAFAVVNHLKDAGEKVEIGTITNFLSAALRARDAKSMIAALRYFEPYLDSSANDSMCSVYDRVRPNDVTYAIMFRLAWLLKHFNMLRVIWRYACVSGHASWLLRFHVRQSLIEYVPVLKARQKLEQFRSGIPSGVRGIPKTASDGVQHTMSRNDLWRGWMGKFAVGVSGGLRTSRSTLSAVTPSLPSRSPDSAASDVTEYGLTVFQPTVRSLSQLESDILRLTSLQSPLPDSLHKHRRTRFYDALKDDLAERHSLRPVIPLPQMLEWAWREDLRWAHDGIGIDDVRVRELRAGKGLEKEGHVKTVLADVFEDMLKQGVGVPMEVGDATL